MDLNDGEIDMLKKDPEFREYFDTIKRKNQSTEPIPPMKFQGRSVEVTQAVFGDNLLDFPNRVWLFSDKNTIYICDRCLLQCWDSMSFASHRRSCSLEIPGKCIYSDREEDISVIEIDGEKERVLCQRICIIGKAFIKRKTLYLDVDGYLFYVLFSEGKATGFFSKEKESIEHNLSCLLILPPYRAKGYGSLMVDLSYILEAGTPEKPLSGRGRALYKRYWRNKVLETLQNKNGQEVSISNISAESGLSVNDTIHGLELLDIDPESHTYDVIGKAPIPSRKCKRNCLIL
ncbi:histone acetyltransferase [Encephalitozoon intestinalis ATCC 50506]|uniref:histone acetyltransferase n=1 Tax=Encephalitozoon intestinalis (strain ATCC 50506) TaxID=876142 RepID=E0S903_ENCIT|nr:histone acetyltransferase [Encephalitozoon intestinalis ATCC 50506]ADM12268.1 histone acetyltransferase [Encephalitozoon intestinalis ATCC 50506]UTX46075.1 histone acetyltransferase [Encephalitozoon intestinalis]